MSSVIFFSLCTLLGLTTTISFTNTMEPNAEFAGPNEEQPNNHTPFDLYNWKTVFLNSPAPDKVLQQFWDNFDEGEWTMWKVHYDKLEGQGVQGWLTRNMLMGMVQRLEPLKQYGFGVLGVYGEEGNYDIEGLWLWKGPNILLQWSQIPTCEFFSFQKLDPKNPAVWNITQTYWLRTQEGDLVEGRPVFEVRKCA